MSEIIFWDVIPDAWVQNCPDENQKVDTLLCFLRTECATAVY